MRCDWIFAETQFGIVLECFRSDAIGILAETQFGIVLGYFQLGAIGIGLRHNLELS